MKRNNKGGILIYMLGMITLLSIVVTEFLLETASAIRYRSQMGGREDLEIIAYSALEGSMAVLGELKLLDKGLYSPVQGWGDPIKYIKFSVPEGYTIKVSIHDETGKLSIYEDDLKNFGNLLVEMGLSYEIVSNLKSELKKYLDKLKKDSPPSPNTSAQTAQSSRNAAETRNGSETRNAPANQERSETSNETAQPNAGRNNNPQRTSNEKKSRILFNLEQLKEIPIFERTFFDAKGNPNEQFKVLKQNVSVLNTGKVNINTAPELVKKLLIGNLKPNLAGKKYLTSMKDLGVTQNEDQEERREQPFGFNASIFDIEIEVTRGPIKYHLGILAEDKKPTSRDENQNTSERSRSGRNARNGRNTSSENAQEPRNAPDRRNGNGSASQTPSRTAQSETKEDFSFLALTEDDSFIN